MILNNNCLHPTILVTSFVGQITAVHYSSTTGTDLKSGSSVRFDNHCFDLETQSSFASHVFVSTTVLMAPTTVPGRMRDWIAVSLDLVRRDFQRKGSSTFMISTRIVSQRCCDCPSLFRSGLLVFWELQYDREIFCLPMYIYYSLHSQHSLLVTSSELHN